VGWWAGLIGEQLQQELRQERPLRRSPRWNVVGTTGPPDVLPVHITERVEWKAARWMGLDREQIQQELRR